MFLVLGLSFATAPSWVAKGVNINYTIGKDTGTFTVLDRTSTSIKLELKLSSLKKSTMPTENASSKYGQFWFDNSDLGNTFVGDRIGEFDVITEGDQTFAGTQWSTVTLRATLSGAVTTKIVDKDTGLLLKQTVDAVGAPTVTLTQYNIAGIGAYPPVVTAPPVVTQLPPKPSTQSNSTQTEPKNTTQTTVTPPKTTDTTVTTAVTEEETPAQTPVTNTCCVPATLFIGLLGVILLKK